MENLLQGIDRWIKSGQADGTAADSVPESGGSKNASKPESASRQTPPPRPEKNIEIEEYLQVDESLPVDVQSGREWGEQFDDFMSDLDFIMLILTSIGMTIAGLGVVNTMLMSVSERIIEIGILKANGWSRRNVLSLIAFESSLLGFGGGCLGSVIGWLATLAVNASFPDRVELYAGPHLLVFSVAFSTLLGLLAGLYPAYWAMRMMPMDAIRRG